MESPLMGLLGVAVVAVLYHTLATAQDRTGQQCYADVPDPYDYFSTKTAYQVVGNQDDSEAEFPGCRPAQFWLTARHGTRYPGDADIVQMSRRLPQLQQLILRNYEAGRVELCPLDLDNIREWHQMYDRSMENKLTESGERELFDMARRFQKRFPTLLGSPYTPEKHKFLTTTKQRAMESGRFFARGLFGDQPVIFPKPHKFDPLLQFYKTCTKWQQQIDVSEASRKERYRFQNSSHMLDTIVGVSRRLGFVGNLSYTDVRLMYDICRYDKSFQPTEISPWCAVFTEHDLKVLEFDMDLEYYWVDSYGYPLNYQQACPQLKDFIDKFSAVRSSEEEQPLANMYFSHLGGVVKFMTRLGLFNDSHTLTSNDFGTERAFRSSRVAAFASNVALVLFECGDGYRVAAYAQEHPVVLPGCGGPLCRLDDVVRQYGRLADTCDVDELCASGGWLRTAWDALLWALPAVSVLV